MIERLLALLDIQRAAVAARPVGQVRVLLMPISGTRGTLAYHGPRRIALICRRLVQWDRARIVERIKEGVN
jgi:hypothetical protein